MPAGFRDNVPSIPAQNGSAAAIPDSSSVILLSSTRVGGGWLGDFLIQRGVRTMVSRKSIIGAGLTMATVLVVMGAYAAQSWAAVALLSLCVFSLRLVTGSVNALPIDLAPPAAVASLTSIQNVFGSIGGLLAPIVTGHIANETGSFVMALLVAGGMALFGAISYVFLMGSGEGAGASAMRAGQGRG